MKFNVDYKVGDYFTGVLLETFKEARIIIQQISKDNNIKTRADWARAVKNGIIPKNIPSVPWHVYAKNKRKKK